MRSKVAAGLVGLAALGLVLPFALLAQNPCCCPESESTPTLELIPTLESTQPPEPPRVSESTKVLICCVTGLPINSSHDDLAMSASSPAASSPAKATPISQHCQVPGNEDRCGCDDCSCRIGSQRPVGTSHVGIASSVKLNWMVLTNALPVAMVDVDTHGTCCWVDHQLFAPLSALQRCALFSRFIC